MSDRMIPLPLETMLRWIETEHRDRGSIFGIDRSLFWKPSAEDPFALEDEFGHRLATPIGPAAGPHTQLTQNILAAWLCGGRFIELKTVQIMDELEIPRPCIDLQDEGYNVEWSQELRLDESRREYVKAWVVVHLLRRRLGVEERPWGTVFNMSVGYNLEGITSPAMTRFMDGLEDAEEEIAEFLAIVRAHDPSLADLEIPSRIVDSVTLSTMHGCPPDEIERIALHLLQERGLHTTVKLNPTLLGGETVLANLHDDLGYTDIRIPDAVFEHDLQYDRAVELIRTLQAAAAERDLGFSVKLSNTLAMANHRGVLPGEEMYMSGRALFPVTMELFHRLRRGLGDDLRVSYCAGVDAINLSQILAAGAWPVTVASDLLKPGGYGRLSQYLERLRADMDAAGATDLTELAANRTNALERAAAAARTDRRYHKAYYAGASPKVPTRLELFDCITAPCTVQCAVAQDVPDYVRALLEDDPDRALEIILARNPLPAVTGYVCTHRCEDRCTRIDYDEPVSIRALKRAAEERGSVGLRSPKATGHRVAIVGAGPSGLAAAYFLARSGIAPTIFEARSVPGGMLAVAPGFRLPREVVDRDVRRILDLGVELRVDHPVTGRPEALLDDGYEAVYVACGFPGDAPLGIEGEDGPGVFHALEFLRVASSGEPLDVRGPVVVIGGGNTAMDAARTAARLSGEAVTVLYRRTRTEMPAEQEELEDLIEEGNGLMELVAPVRFHRADGRLTGVELVRNELGDPDAGGRRRPAPIAGSEFVVEAKTAIIAIGQRADRALLAESDVKLGDADAVVVDDATGAAADAVYAGGDATCGPAIIIEACADGRRAAEAICARFGVRFGVPAPEEAQLTDEALCELKGARSRRVERESSERLPADRRSGFTLVEGTLSVDAARSEAARCLQCAQLCDKCVQVCPNRANVSCRVTPRSLELPVLRCEDGGIVEAGVERFEVGQPRQIVHVEELCNACGNCATFCVHEGKPFED
ncbi:MAG: putative selenate reductase subunit YgfK, partial [Candidatus Bipolaricaulota bacterium]